jgi:hypothetical protein
MAGMTQLHSPRSKATSQLLLSSQEESVLSHLAGRLIQITLAAYLLPALLAVLMVGGVGIFILTYSQLYMGLMRTSVE